MGTAFTIQRTPSSLGYMGVIASRHVSVLLQDGLMRLPKKMFYEERTLCRNVEAIS